MIMNRCRVKLAGGRSCNKRIYTCIKLIKPQTHDGVEPSGANLKQSHEICQNEGGRLLTIFNHCYGLAITVASGIMYAGQMNHSYWLGAPHRQWCVNQSKFYDHKLRFWKFFGETCPEEQPLDMVVCEKRPLLPNMRITSHKHCFGDLAHKFTEPCYTISSDKKSRYDAEKHCWRHGGSKMTGTWPKDIPPVYRAFEQYLAYQHSPETFWFGAGLKCYEFGSRLTPVSCEDDVKRRYICRTDRKLIDALI